MRTLFIQKSSKLLEAFAIVLILGAVFFVAYEYAVLIREEMALNQSRLMFIGELENSTNLPASFRYEETVVKYAILTLANKSLSEAVLEIPGVGERIVADFAEKRKIKVLNWNVVNIPYEPPAIAVCYE